MGLEDTDKIDMLGSNEHEVAMIIFDAFEWNSLGLEDYLDDQDHMELLMEKMNACLHFWESGQIWEQFPGEERKEVVIRVIGLFEPNERANWFYKDVTNKLSEVGLAVQFELDDDQTSIEARREYEEEIKAQTGN